MEAAGALKSRSSKAAMAPTESWLMARFRPAMCQGMGLSATNSRKPWDRRSSMTASGSYPSVSP